MIRSPRWREFSETGKDVAQDERMDDLSGVVDDHHRHFTDVCAMLDDVFGTSRSEIVDLSVVGSSKPSRGGGAGMAPMRSVVA